MVRLQDIACQAGVSRATVSVILNHKGKALRISENTRRHVLGLANRLGYCRNEIARSVVTGKTNAIGFLVGCPSTEHCARLLDGIMQTAYGNGYVVKVLTAEPARSAQDIARICMGHRLAGLIAYGLSDRDFIFELHQQLFKSNISLAIAAGRNCGVDQVISISPNNVQGGGLAFKHLHARGYRAFAIAAEYWQATWAAERVEGFVTAAGEAGFPIPDAQIYRAEGTISPEKDELANWLPAPNNAGIFCVSDYAALTVIGSLQTAGIKVPEDVAVVGYGNLTFARFSRPTITSVEEHLAEIGGHTVRQLLNRIQAAEGIAAGEARSETLEVELVARHSSQPRQREVSTTVPEKR
ncbi:MAG: LacI family DNA-binding transcriptional regulator [Verrucomicrobia bacterium]|nr:LacI family DNA-binding transcriptional regulator [Verrucomicrobiota bacterium]